ncbi:MAG: hypothetical protein AB1597_00010 [Chloroflexota bacterium]
MLTFPSLKELTILAKNVVSGKTSKTQRENTNDLVELIKNCKLVSANDVVRNLLNVIPVFIVTTAKQKPVLNVVLASFRKTARQTKDFVPANATTYGLLRLNEGRRTQTGREIFKDFVLTVGVKSSVGISLELFMRVGSSVA